MIITRTPSRFTLFGSSTDYPNWIKEHGGISVNCAINKYSWMSIKSLPHFFDFKSKVSYSEIECVKYHKDIKHNIIRNALEYLNVNEGIDFVHQADLFSKCGLGSSSTFAVGLINTLSAYQGNFLDKWEIARRTMYLEQDIMQENIGCQDTLAASFGGINEFIYYPNGHISANPIFMTKDNLENFQAHILLLFTGNFRSAHQEVGRYKHTLLEKELQQKRMMEIASEGVKALQKGDLKEVGNLLNKTWQEKRSVIGPQSVDALYELSLANGALGFKLVGAGGGGSILVLVPPEKRENVKVALNLMEIPVCIDFDGTKILYINKNGF